MASATHNRLYGISHLPRFGSCLWILSPIFIESGGADSPRPVTVARNKHGQWKLTSYGSLCVGVRKPASEVDDF
ncbi:MAG: hypothetical protein ACE5H4_05215 [Candidatus Thorarchaeota archaeon]